MRDDPCFRCILSECDDGSPKCVLRRLANALRAKQKRGDHHLVTDEERYAATRIFESWMLERYALAAEGVRPYKRAGSKWDGAAA